MRVVSVICMPVSAIFCCWSSDAIHITASYDILLLVVRCHLFYFIIRYHFHYNIKLYVAVGCRMPFVLVSYWCQMPFVLHCKTWRLVQFLTKGNEVLTNKEYMEVRNQLFHLQHNSKRHQSIIQCSG